MKNSEKNTNLIGQRFGRLLVIKKLPSIFLNNRYFGYWECLCDCGNIKNAITANLNFGGVASCGCIITDGETSIAPGTKFDRLTTISYKKSKWTCLCDCGNTIMIKSCALTSGNTKSCGCLNRESLTKKAHKLIEGRRKSIPVIASARRIWQGYCQRDKEMKIQFDDFYKITQMNCLYCGIKPSKLYNFFNAKSAKGSIKAKEEGGFYFNGLDRIDSNKSHTLDNVVPCCNQCNKAKSDRSLSEFKNWTIKLNCKDFIQTTLPLCETNYKSSFYKSSVNSIFNGYKKDTDLSMEEFHYLSQMNCFYCDKEPSNRQVNKSKKSSELARQESEYLYNGIDRIDSSKGHTRDNVVPCCKYCNWAKGKISLNEFYEWIKRIKAYDFKVEDVVPPIQNKSQDI
jgi:5-methylcytosine-specific restriction endonuclease McrA